MSHSPRAGDDDIDPGKCQESAAPPLFAASCNGAWHHPGSSDPRHGSTRLGSQQASHGAPASRPSERSGRRPVPPETGQSSSSGGRSSRPLPRLPPRRPARPRSAPTCGVGHGRAWGRPRGTHRIQNLQLVHRKRMSLWKACLKSSLDIV